MQKKIIIILQASYGEQFTVETIDELKSMRIANESGELGLVRPRGLVMRLKLDLFSLRHRFSFKKSKNHFLKSSFENKEN